MSVRTARQAMMTKTEARTCSGPPGHRPPTSWGLRRQALCSKPKDRMANKSRPDPEKQGLLDSYERGEWKSVAELPKRLHQYQSYAAAALEAEGLVSIVLPKKDLQARRGR